MIQKPTKSSPEEQAAHYKTPGQTRGKQRKTTPKAKSRTTNQPRPDANATPHGAPLKRGPPAEQRQKTKNEKTKKQEEHEKHEEENESGKPKTQNETTPAATNTAAPTAKANPKTNARRPATAKTNNRQNEEQTSPKKSQGVMPMPNVAEYSIIIKRICNFSFNN